MDVIASQVQRPRRERFCPRMFIKRIGHRAPGEIAFNIGSEEAGRCAHCNRVGAAGCVGAPRRSAAPRLAAGERGYSRPLPRCGAGAEVRIRLAASSSAMKRSMAAVVDGLRVDPAQARPAGKARQANADALVVTPCSSLLQTSSSATSAVLSIGRRPEASMAAARSLRRFAQRLRETFAAPAPWRRGSPGCRRDQAGSGPALVLSLAKVTTAERRSRLRVSDRPGSAASRSRTSAALPAPRSGVWARSSCYAPLRTVPDRAGPERPKGDIREVY